MCLCTYLPILRRNVLFLSVFNVYQFLDVREREREKRKIRNVKSMISFNSGFLLFFFFSPFLKSYSPITPGGKKGEGTQITTSRKKSNEQQRQEPGVFLVLQTKHLDHTIEMVNKEKICIKKNIFYHNNKHVTSKRLSVRVFFFFFL